MPTPLRMILNTFYSGPQAWFFLADDNGYFAEAGLTVRRPARVVCPRPGPGTRIPPC